MEKHTHYRPGTSLHGALVGSGFADRIRAHVHPSGGRFFHRAGGRKECCPDVSGGAANGLRDRRRARVGGKAELGKNRWGTMLKEFSLCDGNRRLKPVLRVSTFSEVAGVGQTIGFCRLPSSKRQTMEDTWAGRPHKTMVCPTSESAKCRKSSHGLKACANPFSIEEATCYLESV